MSRIPPSHSGFYKGPKDLDEKKIVRDVLEEGDAWFNFGDVAYLDKDYYIYFRDRTGDTFRLVVYIYIFNFLLISGMTNNFSTDGGIPAHSAWCNVYHPFWVYLNNSLPL